MKCFALGLSAASLVLLVALEGAAQNAVPPANATGAAPPPAAPTSTETPAQPPPPVEPSATAAPSPAPANPVAPSPAPKTNPTPPPVFPYQSYPYSTGYPTSYGWGLPSEPPKEMPYNGGGIPKGYKLEERYNMGLLIAGPTLFLLGYAIAAFTAVDKEDAPTFNGSVDRRPWNVLFIPVTGPFAFAQHAPPGSTFIYLFEGLGQLCGLGLFLGGILKPKELLVRKNTLEAFHPTLRVGPGSMQVEMKF